MISSQTTILSSAAALAVFLGIYIYWQFGSPASRLRKKLKKISSLVDQEPSALLKDNYLKIYSLYMKLSEREKRNFYPKVTQLRENIEEQLKAEKRIKELLQKSAEAGLEEQRKAYLEVYNAYLKLSVKSQGEYYPAIVQLRERLERGTGRE